MIAICGPEICGGSRICTQSITGGDAFCESAGLTCMQPIECRLMTIATSPAVTPTSGLASSVSRTVTASSPPAATASSCQRDSAARRTSPARTRRHSALAGARHRARGKRAFVLRGGPGGSSPPLERTRGEERGVGSSAALRLSTSDCFQVRRHEFTRAEPGSRRTPAQTSAEGVITAGPDRCCALALGAQAGGATS